MLSYYHINRFITNLLRIAFEDQQDPEAILNPISLRQFICEVLDLSYNRTEASREELRTAKFKMKIVPVKQLWHFYDATTDLYEYQVLNPAVGQETQKLNGTFEDRNSQIQD